MFHFLYSLFFLLLTVLLAGVYLSALVLWVLLIKGAIDTFRHWREVPLYGAWRDGAAESLLRTGRFFRSRRFAYLLLLLVSFHVSLYVLKRQQWMGKENGNYTAKEYWVAGQGVYAWRVIWQRIGGHPEALVMQPLTLLQEWIYRQGYQYLPENDGERGVWTDAWFVYPYSRNMLLPKDSSDVRSSAATIALIERAWQAMEQQAVGTFADREMEEQYYRNFPGEAFFYITYFGHLTGRNLGSDERYLQDAKLMEDHRKLRHWLQQLPLQWETSPKIVDFIDKHQKIEAMRLLTIQMLSSNIIESNIYARTFSCTDQDIQEYIDARNAFVGDGTQRPAWQRMGQSKQGKRLYSIGVNTMQNRFSRYVLKRFCDKEVPGKEETLLSATKTWSEYDWLESSLYATFFEELTILDTMFPDIPYGVGGEDSYKYRTDEYRKKEQEIRKKTQEAMQSHFPNKGNEQKGDEDGTR